MSEMIQDRAVVTMEHQQELVCGLPNGAIPNDLSNLQPSLQGHDIIKRQVTRKWYKVEIYLHWLTNRKSYILLSNGAIFNHLKGPLTQFSRSRRFDAEVSRNYSKSKVK